MGAAIRNRRDDILLASKFGLVWTDEVADGFTVRADRDYLHAACEASLRRLGTDVIDLNYLHHRSADIPIEETIGAIAELIQAGKVRAVGLSSVSADDLRRAHSTHPVNALQERWSLDARDLEESLVPTAAELGVPIVAHSPTGRGALHRPDSADPLTPTLAEIAARHEPTPGQIALAWAHHRSATRGLPVIPLPGTTSVSHARANIAAADIALQPAALARLEHPG